MLVIGFLVSSKSYVAWSIPCTIFISDLKILSHCIITILTALSISWTDLYMFVSLAQSRYMSQSFIALNVIKNHIIHESSKYMLCRNHSSSNKRQSRSCWLKSSQFSPQQAVKSEANSAAPVSDYQSKLVGPESGSRSTNNIKFMLTQFSHKLVYYCH